MDCEKIGNLIRTLRQEKGYTQKQLADKMNISDKTISKWERGLGCPDISLLPELSAILEVNIPEMLAGELSPNDFVGGNMNNSNYFVCPVCANVVLCTGQATVSCCGRKLEPLEPVKAAEEDKLSVEKVEDELYITSSHPMNKDNYISFVAFATGERVLLVKTFPEWDLSVRIPYGKHGKLIWYSTRRGLFYQLI